MKSYVFLFFLTLCWCSAWAQTVTVTPSVVHINPGESVELTASGAAFYQWSPTAGLSADVGETVVASPAATTTYTVIGYGPSDGEKVVNGDFDMGNYGFVSAYQYTDNLFPEGTYYVGANAHDYHVGFEGLGHGGTGNFMIINGSMSPGITVWTEQITVTPNTYYAFSTWVCNVSLGQPDEVARLQFSINGEQLGDVFSGVNQLNVWEQFYVIWNSGNTTSATITILNQNTSEGGNDFGLDDISFRELVFVDDAQSTVFVETTGIPLPDNISSADCVSPSIGHDWGIEVDWSSSENISPLVIPLVGDVDGDGVPEIVCFKSDQNWSFYGVTEVAVFNSLTHSIIHSFSLPDRAATENGAPYGMVKIPNGHVLFIVATKDGKMRAYDLTAMGTTPLWTTNMEYFAANIGFCDFNVDGYPEVYAGNKVFDAETGALLVYDSSISNLGAACTNAVSGVDAPCISPFAANIVGGVEPELILGNEIYSITITNRTGLSGNAITLANSITPPEGVGVDGHPQVADFNNDGYLDVFISNKTTASASVGFYVWDVHNNTISDAVVIPCGVRGKSIPLIADIDGDGSLEIVIQCNAVSGNKVKAYKYDANTNGFSLIWDFWVDEDSYSNSMTAFDFNNNGNLELLISDQSSVKIVNGSGHSHITGNDTIPVYTLTSLSFGECTVMQYPVVADVDADGSAELVVLGRFGSGHTYLGYLNVFKSAGSPWAPARKVWNQYMYNVTNVNQDLSIPVYVYNNATPFTDPDGVVRRPFNNFLQQATTIDPYGRPFYAVPDAAVLSSGIDMGGESATLNVTYTNQGDNTLNAPYHITVFANQLGGQVVQTATVETPLPVGGTSQQNILIPMSSLCQLDDLESLVLAVNCNGGGIAQNGNLQPECDITNNTGSVAVSLQSDTTHITVTVCEEYPWYGQIYTQSGQYETTLVNSYGCDSTLILDLTISDSYHRLYEVSECEGYLWPVNHQWYYESVLDSIVVEGQQGTCDSTFVLDLTIHYGDTLDLDPVEACDRYEWHGQTYAQSGQLTFLTTNEFGCSRLERLALTVNHSDTVTFNITSCGEYEWHEQTYGDNGQYAHETTNEHGCYRLELLNLTVSDSYREEYHEEECERYFWPVNQQWYNQSVLDSIMVEGQQGACDSVFVLDLTIHYGDTLELDPVVSCGSYSWHGQDYSASGQYAFSTTNEHGCDRLELLDLTIGDSYREVDEVEECDSYLWPVNHQWYYESVLDSIVVEGQQGACDSVFVLDLRISGNLSASIVGRTSIYPATDIISGIYPYYVDSTNVDPAAVHWAIDRDDWYVLPHGASCELVCTSAGWGELRAWTEGGECSLDTTLVINASFFGVGEDNQPNVNVYPNPTGGRVVIEGHEITEVRLLELTGREMAGYECGKRDTCVMDVSRCSAGMYLLEVRTTFGSVIKKVIVMN